MKKAIALFRDPAFINFVQCIMYCTVAFCGVLAATGGIPTILTGQIGPVMSAFVGSILIIAGTIGAGAVYTGHWWLERVAIRLFWLGLGLLTIVTVIYAVIHSRNSAIWLIIALEILSIGDAIKRYWRIDWAYLNPSK